MRATAPGHCLRAVESPRVPPPRGHGAACAGSDDSLPRADVAQPVSLPTPAPVGAPPTDSPARTGDTVAPRARRRIGPDPAAAATADRDRPARVPGAGRLPATVPGLRARGPGAPAGS